MFLRHQLQHPSVNKSKQSLYKLHPPSLTIEHENVAAEEFVNILFSDNESCNSVCDVCEFAYQKRLLFPVVYNYFKLLFTGPVTVAKN